MVENLRRFREPATWAVIAIIVAFMALSVVRLVIAMSTGSPMFSAFADIANTSLNLTVVVLLVTLVCTCLFIAPASNNSARVAGAAATVVTLGTLLTVVATGLGVWANVGAFGAVVELVGGLLDIFLKLLAAGSLWVIYRAVSAGRMQPTTTPAIEQATVVRPDEPPVWQPERASASVWRTAAEAATGAPGTADPRPSRWGSPAEGGTAEGIGWHRVDSGEKYRSTPEGSPHPDTP